MEIEADDVLLGVNVEVMVTLGDFVTRAVTVVDKVFDGVVVMVLDGVLEAVMDTVGVYV